MLGEIVERIERRLAVARPAQRTRQIPRLDPQLPAILQKRLEQPQEGAPPFHGAAELVHRNRIRMRRILDRGAGFIQNVAGNGAQGLAHRQSRLQGWLIAHVKVL
jgi:hypothetical protein